MSMNAKIERMSKLLYMAYVELTLMSVVPPALLLTLVNYYIFDLDKESFYLPFRTVYVSHNQQLKQSVMKNHFKCSVRPPHFQVTIRLAYLAWILDRIIYSIYANILWCISNFTNVLFFHCFVLAFSTICQRPFQ